MRVSSSRNRVSSEGISVLKSSDTICLNTLPVEQVLSGKLSLV